MNHVDNQVSLLASEGAAVHRTAIVRGSVLRGFTAPQVSAAIDCICSSLGGSLYSLLITCIKFKTGVDNKFGSGKKERRREESNDGESF